jgi:acetylornithine deacetylase
MSDVVELTRELVRRPSVSGNEAACVELLADRLPGATVSGRNVYAVKGEGERTLLLNSHTDTVPESAEWTRDPWDGALEDGKVRGLGSNDAKGPLAALATAFLEADVPGRLVLAATCDEEIGGQGLGVLRPELPPIDAAIVGEPTGCVPCSGQRGLLRLRLHAEGRRAHASRPHEGLNAIFRAAKAIEQIKLMDLGSPHPLLGPATVQVTMIEGGVAKNVVPPSCVMEIDARTHPDLDNETLRARIEELVDVRVELVSERFAPCATADDEPIVRAAVAAAGTEPRAFGGVSDLFWVRDVPGVVMGPGRSEQSHAADEWIEVEQLERGVATYAGTIRRYFLGEEA